MYTFINRSLRTTTAIVVSLAILFEMPGSTLVSALFLGQQPTLAIIPAVVLLFVGPIIVISSIGLRTPTESPPI